MQYKSLIKSKKNDYCNSKLHSLEEAVKNSDATNFWKCLKSMDDTVKVEDTPLESEENWLLHYESLHSNDRLNPIQQKICNELQEEEDRKKQFRPLDYLITENEIRKAAKKLKNNKSSYSDKIKNEMIKASSCNYSHDQTDKLRQILLILNIENLFVFSDFMNKDSFQAFKIIIFR